MSGQAVPDSIRGMDVQASQGKVWNGRISS